MTQAIPLFLFRICDGCDQPLPLDAHPSRKRHEACAYAAALETSRARHHRFHEPVVREPVQCSDCPAVFTPQPQGAIPKRCPECRIKAVHRWGRETYRRSALAVPLDNTRPCRRAECTEVVRRNGKVYPYYCSEDCKPRCSVDPCEEPARKRDWCAGHYSQWQRLGFVQPFGYKHAEKRDLCLACNDPFEMNGYREFCNAACRAYWFAHDGDLPERTHCIHCLVEIPLGKAAGKERRQRWDIRMCRRCRQDLRKYGMSAQQLANRDGEICRLCGDDVDMTLRAPHPKCPSVDHKIPGSKGGTNDPDNLQLAHLRCNILKHDKLLDEYALAS